MIEDIPNIDHRFGDGRAEILGIAVCDDAGHKLNALDPHSTIVVRISVRAKANLDRPIVGFMFRNHLGVDFAGTNTAREGHRSAADDGGRSLHGGFLYRFTSSLCFHVFVFTSGGGRDFRALRHVRLDRQCGGAPDVELQTRRFTGSFTSRAGWRSIPRSTRFPPERWTCDRIHGRTGDSRRSQRRSVGGTHGDATRSRRGYAGIGRSLDIGCGTGYGAAELAGRGSFAVGIDPADEAVSYARAHYALRISSFCGRRRRRYLSQTARFDLVTAFEVIEHLADWRSLLAESRRVLHDGRSFLVSTPNKLYYAESRAKDGPNPFHAHEFEFEEFRAALSEFFPQREMLLQNRLESFLFSPVERAVRPPDARIDGTPNHRKKRISLWRCAR